MMRRFVSDFPRNLSRTYPKDAGTTSSIVSASAPKATTRLFTVGSSHSSPVKNFRYLRIGLKRGGRAQAASHCVKRS